MMIFTILRKMLNWLQGLLSAVFLRMEKKNDNLRGFAFGGPKSSKRLALIFGGFVVAALMAAALVKRGAFTSVVSVIDRENAPGAKLPTEMNNSFDRNDLFRAQGEISQADPLVDCEAIIRNLRTRGSLTEKEKIDFDRGCRDQLNPSIAKIIDKIIQGEIPASAVADIVANLNDKTADNILKALDSDDVKRALRGEGSEAIAKNLSDLGKLSSSDMAKAVHAITNASPQFRDDVVEGVRSIAQLDPDARSILLNTLDKARSADEVKGIRDFADVIKAADADEQKVFANAFDKAPDIDTRKAIQKAATEIIQIPKDDPVRAKLVEMVKKASELPPEKQKDAFNKLANVANVYRTTDDPDAKRAIGDAILAANGIEDIMALSDRLDDLKTAKEAGQIGKEVELEVIAGRDAESLAQIRAAAELVRSGDKELAAKVLNGGVQQDKIAELLRRADSRKNDPFRATPKLADDVSKDKLESLVKDRQKLRQEKNNLEQKAKEYLRMGLTPGDSRLLGVFKDLARTDDALASLDEMISDVRGRLMQKLKDLKARTSSEYAAAGVALPDFEISLPDDAAERGAPEERLTNLADIKEFWSYDDGLYKKNNRKYFRFNVPSGLDSTKDKSILSAVKGGETSWYASAPGAGGSGNTQVATEFEMSRTFVVPGILHRIPDTCIPSTKASTYTILFEFLIPVANRKTGRIEIPVGSVAICKVKDFENETGRMNAQCNAVDVGGREDIKVNLVIGDAAGADGVLGVVKDNRGWQLAGIFLTAFSAAILDGVTNQFVSPYEQKAQRAAQDYLVIGAGGGASNILRDVAQKQIEDWSKSATWWCGFDGMLSSAKQN